MSKATGSCSSASVRSAASPAAADDSVMTRKSSPNRRVRSFLSARTTPASLSIPKRTGVTHCGLGRASALTASISALYRSRYLVDFDEIVRCCGLSVILVLAGVGARRLGPGPATLSASFRRQYRKTTANAPLSETGTPAEGAM